MVTAPTTAYNLRFVIAGQGEAAGNINANASVVKKFNDKGFATAATDTGHSSGPQGFRFT